MNKLISRSDIQIVFGIIFAVVLPVAYRYYHDVNTFSDGAAINSIIVSSISFLIGSFFIIKISKFPGEWYRSNAVLIFSTCFCLSLAVLLISRLDYSRFLMVTSFILAVVWAYLIDIFIFSRKKLRFWVAPFGSVEELNDIPNAKFTWLTKAAPISDVKDGLIVDFDAKISEEWMKFIAEWTVAGHPAYNLTHIKETLTGKVSIQQMSENFFGGSLPEDNYLTTKRFLDFFFAIIALPVLFLLIPPLWIAIRFDSPGPLFYKQARVGYRGKSFEVFKFRSMVHASEHLTDERAKAMTLDGDPRITRVGKILRLTRLDELPQILNVLRGEMSWIGPRPEALALSEWYEKEIPFYRYRHVVRPGITGWAQVNQGHVVTVSDVREKLMYDFFYIKYFSPWLDVNIIIKSIYIIISRTGAR